MILPDSPSRQLGQLQVKDSPCHFRLEKRLILQDKSTKDGLAMFTEKRRLLVATVLFISCLAASTPTLVTAQETVSNLPQPTNDAPSTLTLTLEEARQRALANNKLLQLATLNVQAKEYATAAVRADYFPKVMGNVVYFHFDKPLGQVLTTKGRPVLGIPPVAINVSVLNQNSPLSTVYVAQPITALLKVRQGVIIGRADEVIAQADVEKARRAIANGVDQLYLGLLAAQQIRAGASQAVKGGEQLAAKIDTAAAQTALLEAKQALQAAEDQIADIEAQLNSLLDLPACTKLALEELPLPEAPLACADDAIGQALAASPEVRAAEQDVVKAHAALKAAKVDYLPNVAVMGGYANQEVASYIQQNIGYVGVVGSYTFFEWGKKKKVVHQWETTVTMAQVKLQQTQQDVRDKAQKAFREFDQDQGKLKDSRAMIELRKQAQKEATTPKDIMDAAKATLLAEVDLVKNEMAFRVAHAQLMTLIGK
jgi:outer membrane protein